MTQSLKKRLLAGDQLNGCFISLFNPIASEIIGSSGYDMALIDMEHGPGSHTEAITTMQALQMHGCAPVIRSSSSNIVDIKRVLDIGPTGIMVPDVRNKAHAEEVVRHCSYAPQGDRGAAPGFMRGSGYGGDVNVYLEKMQNDFLIAVQIESTEAVEQLDSILSVQGIDMIFIGPADLSASMGKLGGFDNIDFKNAFAQIEKQVLQSDKSLGSITFADWDAKTLFNTGHQLVISNSDAILLAKAARQDLAELRMASASD